MSVCWVTSSLQPMSFFFFFGTGADFHLSVIFHVERQLEASHAFIKSVR